MKILKQILLVVLIFGVACLASLAVADLAVEDFAGNKVYTSIEKIPVNDVGLVLGTAKYHKSGAINPFYQYRIDAAVELYENGKVKYLLISGDNSTEYYNEPQTFKNDLIARGIPAERIYLDYAGFRTFDSMVRAKAIFGQEKFTIISQPFHNERALYIAHKKGMDPIAYNARDVSFSNGIKVNIREKFARVLMMMDVHVIQTQPKFYGERILIK